MNKIIHIIGGLLTAIPLWSQTATAQENNSSPSAWAQRIEAFGKTIPQEKAYLHLDNTCYFLGDTIWYKAYVTRTDTHTPTNLSKIIYVELLTPDGFLIERQQIAIGKENGGKGAFVLQDTLYAGYYEVRAYTRWMLNFGKVERKHSVYTNDYFYNQAMANDYFRDYEKLYSRVIPVYNKPSGPGNFAKEMTMRPMRRYFKGKKQKPKLDIRFYPEGGDLIANTTARIAFEANNENGEHLNLKMDIRDKKGNTITQAQTVNRGRGVFDLNCSAESGENYEAVFKYNGYEFKLPLPSVVEQGCAMRIENRDQNLTVTIKPQAIPATTQLGFTIINSGKVVTYKDVKSTIGETTTLNLPLTDLPTGVNQITLFDGNGRVYAERLFFVNHKDYAKTTLDISGLKKEYTPYEPIRLQLQLQGHHTTADVSVTIRDKATEDLSYDNTSILSEMLLSSEIKGFVENPGYYFEKDDAERKQALDLLMMVQGWRRYVWRNMAGQGNFKLTFLPEKGQTLSGCVNKTISLDPDKDYTMKEQSSIQNKENDATAEASDKNYSDQNAQENIDNQKLRNHYSAQISSLKKEVNVFATYVQGNNIVESEQLTKKGSFYMQTPVFSYESILFLSASDTTITNKELRRQQKGFADESEYADYYVKLNHFYPVFCSPYSFYQDNQPDNIFDDSSLGTTFSSIRELPTIEVRSKKGGLRKFDKTKPALVVDAYEAFNLTADYGLNAGKYDYRTFPGQVARAFIGDMGMDRNYSIQVRYDGKVQDFGNSKARTNTGTRDYIMQIPVSTTSPGGFAKKERYKFLKNLDQIRIYTDYAPREQGSWKFDSSNQPEVIVDICSFENEAQRYTYRDRRYILSGFSECNSFYSPNYSTKPLPEIKDYRRTLYWEPNLKLDSEGKAEIILYNNSTPSFIVVNAEGITKDGTLLTKTIE